MIITFWITLHGQACTTANMLAVALLSAMKYNKKTMITQTHFDLNNLEIPLVGKVTEKDFYRDTGLDALIRYIKSAPITEEAVNNCSISLMNHQLNLLIGTKQQSRSVFEEDTTRLIIKILKDIGKYFELVFVDTNSGNGVVTKTVLNESDLIVVNLSQNRAMIESYFENDYGLDEEKVFYLFGAYDKDSRYSIENIRRKYKQINKKNSGVIPYNIEYADAFSDGRIMKYISRNIGADEDNEAYCFVNGIQRAVSDIFQKMSINI